MSDKEKIRKSNRLAWFLLGFAFAVIFMAAYEKYCTYGGGVITCAKPGISSEGL